MKSIRSVNLSLSPLICARILILCLIYQKFVLYVSRTLPHYLYKNIFRWRILVVNVVYAMFQVFGEVGEGLKTLMQIIETFVDDNFKPHKNIR
jgi:hypothetical protein